MFFSILMLFVAVVLAIPAITGKGKLLTTENIKKDKIPLYKKCLRIAYACMIVIVLFMAFFNFIEKEAYVQTNYYEFTEEYLAADGQVHPAGESHDYEEMRALIVQTESSGGSLCAPSESDPIPVKYTHTVYTLQEKYAFLGFLNDDPETAYKTARILNLVGLGVSMAIVFFIFIFINRMTDKKAQQQNSRSAKQNPVRPSMPRGAFDFSDYKDEVEVKDDMFSDARSDESSKKK